MTRSRSVLLALVAIVVCTSAVLALDDEHPAQETDEPPHVEPRTGVTHPEQQLVAVGELTFTAHLEEVGAWQHRANQVWWNDSYLPAVQAELDAQRAAEQAAAQQRSREQYVPPAPSSGGDCSGFNLPDHIIQRESGGNPHAQNPSSGAYGCAQTLPSHYSGGICAGLDYTIVDHQRECVDRLLANGGLNHWAATR